jgi:two-component system, NtrC family, nitrogen regulation response regulator GlnG
VLADGEFYRVGGVTPVKVNVRVIAATHQDLEERVKQGLFREDLFHRLNVIRLKLPALRERHEDIATLAKYFLQKSARELKVDAKQLSDNAVKHLSTHPFPGNVRQLENLCHWLTVMAPAQSVDINDLPPEFRGAQGAAQAATHIAASTTTQIPSQAQTSADPILSAPAFLSTNASTNTSTSAGSSDLTQWRNLLEGKVTQMLNSGEREVYDTLNREFESALILQALAFTHGRRIEASQLLGIGRNTLTRKVQELGLDRYLGEGDDKDAL